MRDKLPTAVAVVTVVVAVAVGVVSSSLRHKNSLGGARQ
jgi:hypothetical protein